MRGRENQKDTILRLLREAKGNPVPAYKLAREGGGLQFQTRIHELRKEGHVIQNDMKRVEGVTHSTYRLIENQQPDLFPHEPKEKRGVWLEVVGRRF